MKYIESSSFTTLSLHLSFSLSPCVLLLPFPVHAIRASLRDNNKTQYITFTWIDPENPNNMYSEEEMENLSSFTSNEAQNQNLLPSMSNNILVYLSFWICLMLLHLFFTLIQHWSLYERRTSKCYWNVVWHEFDPQIICKPFQCMLRCGVYVRLGYECLQDWRWLE